MSRIAAIVLALVWSPLALAHAWEANAPVWSRSYAEARVPGDQEVTDSGVTFGQSTATATAANGNANAFAHAHSIGLWGGNVKATANGAGAWAGTQDPFNVPVVPGVGPGSAELDYSASLGGSTFSLSGNSSHNANGYLELAVLDITGMTQDAVSEIFLHYGSVGSALSAGYLDSSQVLFQRRETSLGDSFNYSFDVGSIDYNALMVTGVSHAVAAVPEPSTVALLGLGGFAVMATSRRRLARAV